MSREMLYEMCPLCAQAPIELDDSGAYRCQSCGLALKEQSILGLFRKDKFSVEALPEGKYTLAERTLKTLTLSPDELKIVLANVYPDQTLAKIAAGDVEAITPVQTVLAQIILEQLREECFINVKGLRRAHGAPLASEESWYLPKEKAPEQGLEWQDRGNLFCTTHRLVLPSNQFTFLRLDRKISVVQAYTNGIAIQRKREAFSTYFIGCYAHESALVAAYVMAKVPKLRPAEIKEAG